MGYTIGIDLGSTAIKVVFVQAGAMVWQAAVPTAPGQEALAQKVIAQGLRELSATSTDIQGIATTGYGKKLVANASKIIDEVSANALGIFLQNGRQETTIINIGGQDIKIIRIDATGKLIDFKMNDKCAAGTGRFFEMVGRILDTSIYEFAALAKSATKAATLNSTCVVFAESEIVSLLAKGTPRENIIRGLHESIARRISGMIGDDIPDLVYLDGGSANNLDLATAIGDELLVEVCVLEQPQFTVAFGAACALDS